MMCDFDNIARKKKPKKNLYYLELHVKRMSSASFCCVCLFLFFFKLFLSNIPPSIRS